MESEGAESFKKLPFCVGVKSLEQSVLEVDEAVKDFIRSSSCLNRDELLVNSWKYPGTKLEQIDIPSLVRNLRGLKLAGDAHYIHIIELLIDRLYYALLSGIKFLSIMYNSIASPNEEIDESFSDLIGPGGDFNGLSVANPLSCDSKLFNTNIAIVIHKFHTILSGLDGAISNLGKPAQHKHKNKGGDRRHLQTQTEISCIEQCETCCQSQDSLKRIGERLEKILSKISPKQNSHIGEARTYIAKNFYSSSQWGAVMRWIDGMTLDSEIIEKLTLENSKQNLSLEQDLKKATQSLSTHSRDHQLIIQKYEKKINVLEAQSHGRKKEKQEWGELQQFLETRIKESETRLAQKEEELRREIYDKDSLFASLKSLEKTNQELKTANYAANLSLKKLQKEMSDEVKGKHELCQRVETLGITIEKQKEEIVEIRAKMNKESEENLRLRTENNSLKNAMINANNEIGKQKELEVERLKKSLKEAESKVQLLTLYPDLNGPINSPVCENENIVETMENQLKANTARVQVLLKQSEGLASTLKKMSK